MKVIVFDLHGILTKEAHFIRNILLPICKEIGVNIEYKELKELYNKLKENEKYDNFYRIVPEKAVEMAIKNWNLKKMPRKY